MNTVVTQSKVQMDSETLKSLTTEVRETFATGIDMPATKKRFAVVDLWRINQAKKQTSRITRKWAI